MNPFTKIWFWLLIFSLIGFILTAIFFETMGQTSPNNNTTPVWIWVIFILSVVFLIIALILYVIDLSNYYYQLEIATACGQVQTSCPTRQVVCPQRNCTEKRFIECTETKRPCEIKIDPCNPCNPSMVINYPPIKECVEKRYVECTNVPGYIQEIPCPQSTYATKQYPLPCPTKQCPSNPCASKQNSCNLNKNGQCPLPQQYINSQPQQIPVVIHGSIQNEALNSQIMKIKPLSPDVGSIMNSRLTPIQPIIPVQTNSGLKLLTELPPPTPM